MATHKERANNFCNQQKKKREKENEELKGEVRNMKEALAQKEKDYKKYMEEDRSEIKEDLERRKKAKLMAVIDKALK